TGGVGLQHSAEIGAVGSPIFIDDLAENHHLSRSENVGGTPVEGGPIDGEPQIALFLGREATNRRAVERQVIPALDQELLVVIENVQPAFEVAEQQRHGLDPLLVSQVLEALLLNLLHGNAFHSLILGVQIQFFQFRIRKSQKIL